MITLDDVRAAQARIKPYVRRTPLMRATPLKEHPFTTQNLTLKLESLQVTGSFKARGAVSKMTSLTHEEMQRGIIAASGGNHGVAVAYAGWLAKEPAIVYLPESTPESKINKLRKWGAQVVLEGDVFDEANRAALARAERDGLAYIHPFADPMVIAGQGTIGLEILEEVQDIDTLLIAIGGGGLASGISSVAKTLRPDLRIIGVEPTGAPTLYESVAADRLVELAEITTVAGTLAPRKTSAINLDIIRKNVDEIVLVSDEEMVEASRWLWFEMGVAAEMSGAAAMAALLCGKISTEPDEHVCVLVCGAGTGWMEMQGNGR